MKMAENAAKILIIDDEYVLCRTLKLVLEKSGYEAIYSQNGGQALDLVESERPDLITLDMRMPGMSGAEVLKELKARKEGAPVLVLTALDVPDMEKAYLELGAAAVLGKPVNMETLVGTIRRILASHGFRS